MSDPHPLPAAVVRRRRLQLIALAALFLGPLGLSAVLYYGSSLRPAGHVQHGELLDPPRLLPGASLPTPQGTTTRPDFLRYKWTLLMVASDDCDARCAAALATTRAARLALEADASRVQRVLLSAAGCCGTLRGDAAQADLVTAYLDAPDGRRLLGALVGGEAPPPASGWIYLVDPLGNLLMRYAPGTDPQDLLKDLSRLLRLSQIG